MPTIYHRASIEMVGTLRFAHPTNVCSLLPNPGARSDIRDRSNIVPLRFHLLPRTDLLRAQAQSRCTIAIKPLVGQITQNLTSPSRKNIPLSFLRKSSA